MVASVAAALRDRYGVGPGDRVAILAANCPEWIVTFWATVSLGAIAVGLNGWWVGPEIRYGIEDSDPEGARRRRQAPGPARGRGPGRPDDRDRGRLRRDLELRPRRAAARTSRSPRTTPRSSSTRVGRPADRRARSTRTATSSPRSGLSFFHGARMAMLNPADPDALPACQLVTSPLFHVSGLHMTAVAYLVGGVRSIWTIGKFDPVTVMQLIERRADHALVVHRDDVAPRRDPSRARRITTSRRCAAVAAVARRSRPRLQRRAKEALPEPRQHDGRRLRPDRVRGARDAEQRRGAQPLPGVGRPPAAHGRSSRSATRWTAGCCRRAKRARSTCGGRWSCPGTGAGPRRPPR